MSEISLTAPHGQPPAPAGLAARPLTLAEEHVLLLWQVTESAGKLLAATEYGRWPAAELASLAGYARAELLRQVRDEEALLFPAVPNETVAGLARDHVRLRAAAELLTRAATGEQPMSLGQLAAAVRGFVAQLERHLRNEDDLLAPEHAPAGSGPHTAATIAGLLGWTMVRAAMSPEGVPGNNGTEALPCRTAEGGHGVHGRPRPVHGRRRRRRPGGGRGCVPRSARNPAPAPRPAWDQSPHDRDVRHPRTPALAGILITPAGRAREPYRGGDRGGCTPGVGPPGRLRGRPAIAGWRPPST